MSRIPIALLMTTFAAAVGAQSAGPVKGKVVDVEIVVDTLDNHATACKGGKVLPSTVLVAGKAVRHCVDGTLLEHDADEKKNADAFSKTLVNLSRGDSIRWTLKGKNKFRVVEVQRHTPLQPGAPAYPFLEPLPTTFSNTVTIGAVLDLSYEVVQRYKISFEIDTPGNRVDPDIVCSM